MLSSRLLCACAVFALLPSCADRHEPTNKEEALESATGANVQVVETESGESITFEDNETRTTFSTGEKLAAPANYPSSGFIPDDAVIQSSATQDLSMIVVYSVPGSLSEVFERNRGALRDRGWTEEDVMPVEGGSAYVSYVRGAETLSEELVAADGGRVKVMQRYDSGD